MPELLRRAKNAAQSTCHLIGRLRRRDKLFLAIEVCICLSLLLLFALAYPDRYRSKLWENGGAKGWNSNPKLRIYFYANHKEPPEIPLIWTQRLTDSNLAVAILSFFVLAARVILLPLNYLPLWVETLYDFLLLGLWGISTIGQASGDFSDLDHLSHHPWYLTRSCGESWASTRASCQMAQASFIFSSLAIVFYLCRTASHLVDVIKGGQSSRLGREDPAHWTCDIEGKFSDIDTLLDSEHLEVQKVYTEALSPVLAFFPPDGERWG